MINSSDGKTIPDYFYMSIAYCHLKEIKALEDKTAVYSGVYWNDDKINRYATKAFTGRSNLYGLFRVTGVWLGGYADSKLIGYIGFTSSKTKNVIRLDKIVIDSAYQRKGLGTKLIKDILMKVIGTVEGCLVKTEIWERNVDAQLFLKSLGFRCVKNMPNRFTAFDDDCEVVYDENGYVFEYNKDIVAGKLCSQKEAQEAIN